jgi:hypothetical protein
MRDVTFSRRQTLEARCCDLHTAKGHNLQARSLNTGTVRTRLLLSTDPSFFFKKIKFSFYDTEGVLD